MLGNPVGDLASGLFGTGDVDPLPEGDGGEHRRNRGCCGLNRIVRLRDAARRPSLSAGWIGQSGQELGRLDLARQHQRCAERISLRDANVRGLLDEEDALLCYGEPGSSLFQRGNVCDRPQVGTDDDRGSSVRKLCFYIEPLAGNGELPSKKRAEPEELLGSVGQYVHEHDWCLRSWGARLNGPRRWSKVIGSLG
ncbi:hypothetical protein ACVWWO_002127 [Bradyrhizobium sp. F1.13.1]